MTNIIQNLDQTPEFAALIPSQLITKFRTVQSQHPSNSSDPIDVEPKKAALRELFGALMTTPTEDVKIQVEKLVERYSNMSENEVANSPEGYLIPLVLELHRQFPSDIGIFCVYVLNIVNLRPGESIFLGSGEPHAYISGDIIECMATSDNVLRAGLTPKPRDVANLLESLTYNMGTPTKHMIAGTPWGSGDNDERTKTILYDPPVSEFSVLNVQLKSGETEHHRGIDGPSVVIVTGGKGEMIGGMNKGSLMLEEGNVLFIGAGAEIIWRARHGDFELFRAFCE